MRLTENLSEEANGSYVTSRLWGIKWSRDRWRYLTLKG